MPPSQYYHEPKIALKNKVIFKKEKKNIKKMLLKEGANGAFM